MSYERVVIGDDDSAALMLAEYTKPKDCYRLFSDISKLGHSVKIRILSKKSCYVGLKELLTVVRKGKRVVKVLNGNSIEFWELEKNR